MVDPETGFYVIRRHFVSELQDVLAGPFATAKEAMVARGKILEADRSTPLEVRRGVQHLSRRRLRRAIRDELLASFR